MKMSVHRLAPWVVLGLLVSALASGGVFGATTNAVGKALPADAAPPDAQVLRVFSQPAETIDSSVTWYKRPQNTDSNPWTEMQSSPLMRVDKNFNLVPAGAKSWEVSKDGLTWTFRLDQNQVWSDGTPVTADDYVTTFRFEADPKHAWDFAWYFSFIKGWDDAVKGKTPTDGIGIKRGVDPYTLLVTTTDPTPFLPQAILYSVPLNAKYLAKYGPYYNNDPKTSISSGPYILQEWAKDQRIVYVANSKYRGIKPYVTKVEIKFADLNTEFDAYRNNEIDVVGNFSPAQLQIVDNDPMLRAQYRRGFDDFRIFYLGFDTDHPPFDNLKVRQAFSRAVDREGIAKNILKQQGVAAYGMLMPGFPGSNQSDLKPIQDYDPAAAKRLLSDAGYPDGKGFPKLDLWLRSENALGQAVGNAIGAGLKQNLGIDVNITNQERKLFMETLNSHKLQFYMVPYGMDYLDPSNMLGIWVSGGRHAWKNAEFDKLVKTASGMMGNQQQRMTMFHQAEKILMTDVGFVPLFHPMPGFMWKPYVKGDALTTNKLGLVMWPWQGWAGFSTMHQSVYISKDVGKR
jgi:ABC-type oligopeptide transport system substrate-binding subunit